jgi:hypothetical protein
MDESWRALAAGALNPGVTFVELGPALQRLVAHPGCAAARVAKTIFAACKSRMFPEPPPECRQRDVLPFRAFVASAEDLWHDVRPACFPAKRGPGAFRAAWLLLFTFALNFEYSLNVTYRVVQLDYGPSTAVQRKALGQLVRAASSMEEVETPQLRGPLGWPTELKTRRISCDGSEIALPERLMLNQFRQALPPAGVAVLVSAVGFSSGEAWATHRTGGNYNDRVFGQSDDHLDSGGRGVVAGPVGRPPNPQQTCEVCRRQRRELYTCARCGRLACYHTCITFDDDLNWVCKPCFYNGGPLGPRKPV